MKYILLKLKMTVFFTTSIIGERINESSDIVLKNPVRIFEILNNQTGAVSTQYVADDIWSSGQDVKFNSDCFEYWRLLDNERDADIIKSMDSALAALRARKAGLIMPDSRPQPTGQKIKAAPTQQN